MLRVNQAEHVGDRVTGEGAIDPRWHNFNAENKNKQTLKSILLSDLYIFKLYIYIYNPIF